MLKGCRTAEVAVIPARHKLTSLLGYSLEGRKLPQVCLRKNRLYQPFEGCVEHVDGVPRPANTEAVTTADS